MADVHINQSLYALLLSTVIFLSVFVLIVRLIPAEAYNPLKNYKDNYQPSDYGAESINAFSYTSNFTLVFDGGWPLTPTKVWFNDTEIHFTYSSATALTNEQNAVMININHFQWSWWIWPTNEAFHSTSAPDFDYPTGHGSGTPSFSPKWLMQHYDNKTDTATFSAKCDHITLRFTITSNSTAYTLPDALKNRQPIHFISNWSFDFTAMGANIWSLLGSILTFQSIVTENAMVNVVLNTLISIPIWVSITYILYKLITGLIPFLSGGTGT
jgi:hypothetical protein